VVAQPVTSAQRKFFRGAAQVKTLCAEADAFENRNAYEFRMKIESRSNREITYRCLAVEREAPERRPLLALVLGPTAAPSWRLSENRAVVLVAPRAVRPFTTRLDVTRERVVGDVVALCDSEMDASLAVEEAELIEFRALRGSA
jgi:hypothetical protein